MCINYNLELFSKLSSFCVCIIIIFSGSRNILENIFRMQIFGFNSQSSSIILLKSYVNCFHFSSHYSVCKTFDQFLTFDVRRSLKLCPLSALQSYLTTKICIASQQCKLIENKTQRRTYCHSFNQPTVLHYKTTKFISKDLHHLLLL